jgi:hypothetical protein
MPLGRSRPRCCAALLGAALLGLAAPASAQSGSRVALEWTAPAGCPDREQVLAEIDRLIGDASHEPLTVVGTASPNDGRWTVQLQLTAGASQGSRTLEAETCTLAVQAAALVVALAAQPQTPQEPPQAAPIEPSTPMRVAFLVRPFASLDVGVLPLPGTRFGLAAGVRLDRFRIEAGASHGLSRAIGLPDRGTVRVQPLASVQARGCWGPRLGRWVLEGCVGGEGTLLRGESAGVSSPSVGEALWLGAFLGGGAGLRLWGPVFLRLDAELGVGLQRPSFQVAPQGEVFRPEPVFARAALGLELELP